MTQDEKDLLLKDLCTRLPYGVKVQCLSHQIPLKILSINPNGVTWVTGDKGYPFEVDWKDCKPYLFPISSMTEEQSEELMKLINTGQNDNNEFMRSLCSIEFYHKHHFDIYGLIPMGLAIDVTGKNIY